MERDEILQRLVDLHDVRAQEEKQGLVRWLRPEYQQPRFGKGPARSACGAHGRGGARNRGRDSPVGLRIERIGYLRVRSWALSVLDFSGLAYRSTSMFSGGLMSPTA